MPHKPQHQNVRNVPRKRLMGTQVAAILGVWEPNVLYRMRGSWGRICTAHDSSFHRCSTVLKEPSTGFNTKYVRNLLHHMSKLWEQICWARCSSLRNSTSRKELHSDSSLSEPHTLATPHAKCHNILWVRGCKASSAADADYLKKCQRLSVTRL
eukprot:1161270-Pelagomonas_calceolata.AAC.2